MFSKSLTWNRYYFIAKHADKLILRRIHQQVESNKSTYNYNEAVQLDSRSKEKPLQVHAIWLRHHCQCELCFNRQTHQRVRIPSDLPSVSTIENFKHKDDKLMVIWNDGHESQFDISWLKKYAPKVKAASKSSAQHQQERIIDYLENTNPNQSNVPQQTTNPLDTAISFTDFMKDGDEGVSNLLSNVTRHGYGIVKECPADFETTKRVIAKVSHPQNTIFGDFSEWTSNLAHADTAYTSDVVHLHNDTTYFTEPAGLQIFHCLKHEGDGGVNFLADGYQIARKVALDNLKYYRQLASVNVPSQYIDVGKHYFYSNDVIFGHDWFSGRIAKIRYNPHDMATLKDLSFDTVGKFYESLVYWSNLLERSPQSIKLVPGITIFLDNWRILHGRSAFTGFRHLCGAYISRSDWLSRARTLGVLQE